MSGCSKDRPKACDRSLRLARPSTTKRLPSRRIAAGASTSCSSRISPTISSRMSSRVISPEVPPNSSTTIARWAGPRWNSRSWLSRVFVSGTKSAGRTRSCQRAAPRGAEVRLERPRDGDEGVQAPVHPGEEPQQRAERHQGAARERQRGGGQLGRETGDAAGQRVPHDEQQADGRGELEQTPL